MAPARAGPWLWPACPPPAGGAAGAEPALRSAVSATSADSTPRWPAPPPRPRCARLPGPRLGGIHGDGEIDLAAGDHDAGQRGGDRKRHPFRRAHPRQLAAHQSSVTSVICVSLPTAGRAAPSFESLYATPHRRGHPLLRRSAQGGCDIARSSGSNSASNQGLRLIQPVLRQEGLRQGIDLGHRREARTCRQLATVSVKVGAICSGRPRRRN